MIDVQAAKCVRNKIKNENKKAKIEFAKKVSPKKREKLESRKTRKKRKK
jgi:hypothetical protein